jgi:hypothetical protein
MPMKLSLDSKREREQTPMIQNELWLDVSDIARGVGFTTAVQISIHLKDALEPHQNERDGDYDQRLYDCLWLAHFQLSIDQSQSATFNFSFTRMGCKAEEASEISLRLRAETQKQVVLLGLLKDFWEAA